MTKRWSTTRSGTGTKKAASKKQRHSWDTWADTQVLDREFDDIETQEFEVRGEFGRGEDYD